MTVYVHNMVRNKQTFADFALSCSRAFGALVEMRDEPMDAEIPKEFKPSDYHVKELAKAKKELRRLKGLGGFGRIAFGNRKKVAILREYRSALKNCRAENIPLLAMIDEVRAWEPPTPDHVELKKFMEQQLTTSLTDEKYWLESIAKHEPKPELSYYHAAVVSAERDVAYHSKGLQEEKDRISSRNGWLNQLRKSLEQVA